MYSNSLMRNRLRTSAEGGGGEGNPAGNLPGNPPKNEWKAPSDEAEFNRIIEDRLKRERNKFRDYESLQEKARQWDELANESQTEREREVNEARLEAFHEVMSQQVPRVIRAEFKAQAKGILTTEQVDSLLEDLDLVKYATDDGDPDEEKIAKKISAFAPAKGGGGNNGTTPPGFGQGSGHQQSTRRPGEGGLAEAKRRWPEQFASAGKS